MPREYRTIQEVAGPLMLVHGVEGVTYDELGEIERALPKAFDALKSGGILAAISFHSLEDRAVKEAFAELAQGCTCPRDFPVCVCGNKPKIKIVSKKPIVSSPEELKENPRAHSAKLRVAEKL